MERKENREDDLDLCREEAGERAIDTVDNRMDLYACFIGPHTYPAAAAAAPLPLRKLLLGNSVWHRQLDGQTDVLHEREVMQRGRGMKQEEDKGRACGGAQQEGRLVPMIYSRNGTDGGAGNKVMSLPYRWKAHPCPPVLSKPSPNEHHSARRASPVTVTRPGASTAGLGIWTHWSANSGRGERSDGKRKRKRKSL